jgi:hypothetical protein
MQSHLTWGAVLAALVVAGCNGKTVPPPEPKAAPRVEQPGSAPRAGTTGAVGVDAQTTRTAAERQPYRD